MPLSPSLRTTGCVRPQLCFRFHPPACGFVCWPRSRPPCLILLQLPQLLEVGGVEPPSALLGFVCWPRPQPLRHILLPRPPKLEVKGRRGATARTVIAIMIWFKFFQNFRNCQKNIVENTPEKSGRSKTKNAFFLCDFLCIRRRCAVWFVIFDHMKFSILTNVNSRAC